MSDNQVVSPNDLPAPPPESSWTFIKDLQKPVHQTISWLTRGPRKQEVDFRSGLTVDWQFPDPGHVLDTMGADFRRFLSLARIPANPAFILRTVRDPAEGEECYRVEVSNTGCSIVAGDTEGIRRGLVFVEDEMMRAGGPFLKRGTVRRRSVIRTRVSRCFFGPIKRPPKNRDELTDEVNYYPDEYLNRLAHDGVNGLWLTIEFKDVCPSSIIPEFGKDAERRLAKLRQTVERCGRYGVKIFVFCIEPAALPSDSPILQRHPELRGNLMNGRPAFCTGNPLAQAYLEEATRNLFSAVPGLGGLIDISVGEKLTHCYSARGDPRTNTCPRCKSRKQWEVLAEVLSAMERGMHAANPKAELISWPYSQYSVWGERLTRDAAAHVPSGVILQHNFESAGRVRQLGRIHYAGDYWLSYVGPSALYKACARAAVKSGRRMSAKLQVGSSHEVSTVPFVPVPGNLYKKYRAMHRLGVSAAMYCWYFGNYPSIMTKAAGELAFAPFPKSENRFLRALAGRDWGRNAGDIVKAWREFQRGYNNYPISGMMGYYGPMHDGPVWPLYLKPRDLPLAPTWLLQYPPSGDRIGEFICFTHTADEIETLFSRMVRHWRKGMTILDRIKPAFQNNPDRLLDIGVAAALGLQFQSGLNILRFYRLRDKLLELKPAVQLRELQTLRRIVKDEMRIDRELLALCRQDSRLGFHSEAEGYKYYPARIEWRLKQLEQLLAGEFPDVERLIQDNTMLFPEYTGRKPTGLTYHCRRFPSRPPLTGMPAGSVWDLAESVECAYKTSPHDYFMLPMDASERADRKTVWKAGYDDRYLYVGIKCREPNMDAIKEFCRDGENEPFWLNDCAGIVIEPQRLWPCMHYLVNPRGTRQGFIRGSYRWEAGVMKTATEWTVTLKIPLKKLLTERKSLRPFRFDIWRVLPRAGTERTDLVYRWSPHKPKTSRLAFRTEYPADLGWMIFEP